MGDQNFLMKLRVLGWERKRSCRISSREVGEFEKAVVVIPREASGSVTALYH